MINRHLSLAVAGFAILSSIGSQQEYAGKASNSSFFHENISNLSTVIDSVFVTEDNPLKTPGCDAISILPLQGEQAPYKGVTRTSPGRLTASPNFETVIAGWSNSSTGPFLYILSRKNGNGLIWKQWILDKIDIPQFAVVGIPTNEIVLVPIFTLTDGYRTVRLKKFLISEMNDLSLGSSRGEIVLGNAIPIAIIPTNSGSRVHIVTDDSHILTIDTNSMNEISKRIAFPHFSPNYWQDIDRSRATFATITADGRFLLTNRVSINEIAVADLVSRQAWSIKIPNLTRTGSVAINRGWKNSGLLAIHGGNNISVYRFLPPDRIELLSRVAIPEPSDSCNRYSGGGEIWYDCSCPYLGLAWSTSGDEIIAASSNGTAEFVVIGVSLDGNSLVVKNWLTACPDEPGRNYPQDILTGNGYVFPTPGVTTTPPTMESPTFVPSRTSTTAPSPVDEATPTFAPTRTPTRYLLNKGRLAVWIDEVGRSGVKSSG